MSPEILRSSPIPAEISRRRGSQLRLGMLGCILILVGIAMQLTASALSLIRLTFFPTPQAAQLVANILWYSGMPVSLGLICAGLDLFVLLPGKRRQPRRIENCPPTPTRMAVALMSYNDEASIGEAVRDFAAHPMVAKVI